MSTPVLIGTHNKGKVEEIKEILGELNLRLLSLEDFPSLGVAEGKRTYVCRQREI
jgi:hypothetical protein